MTLLAGLRLPWRQRSTADTDSVTRDTDQAPPVVRVWLLSGTSEREVELRLSASRVSDSLNDPTGPWIREQTGELNKAEPWSRAPRSEVLVVVPPDQPTDRLQRLHRTARRVRVVMPPYEVVGNAHVQPGTDAAAYLHRHGRDFVALTRATLRRDAEDLGVVPVALVNLRAATRITSPDEKAG